MDAFEMPLSIAGIPVRKSFIPAGNSNRPGTPATAEGRQWITVHETGNFNTGANAEMHRRYTHGAGGWGGGGHPATADTEEYEGVSFTFVVDDTEIVWLLPLEEKSWQASDGADGPGNSSTSIETCVNADGNWPKTKENVAQLVAYLATHHPEKSPDRVAQHNKWARDKKNCPARLRASNGAEWNALIARVHDIAGDDTDDALYLTYPDGTRSPYPIVLGFRAWCEAQGRARGVADLNAAILSVTGYPQGAEYVATDGRTYQRFERLTLQYSASSAPPFDVVPILCGTALPPEAA